MAMSDPKSLPQMSDPKLDETIIAISTPFGYGGLGIVRLSGKRSLAIAKKIFKPKKKKSFKILPRAVVLGNIFNFEQKELFDEGYLTFFPAPHSYTTENMVEISCHGSPVILEEVVRLGIKAGARLAHPGEFTLRAYLRGRIDILQAEAVNDLIQATSLQQARVSFSQIQGKLSQKISSLRSKIVHVLAQIEASLEFPDEGLPISSRQIAKTMDEMIYSIRRLIDSYDIGKILAEGLSLAITGRTNVGKSTLFNSLLEKERAIVTPFPGTTRDYLEERIKIRDSIFKLIDMAGLARTAHPVEEEGVRRGEKIASQADGLLLIFDASRKETSEDVKLAIRFKNKKALFLFNKIDLPRKINKKKILALNRNPRYLEISALKGTNLDKLKELIYEFFVPPLKNGEEIILHLRQKLLLEEIHSFLTRALELLRLRYPEEIWAEEVRKIIPLIGQLTGEIKVDEIIEAIFSRFCVGK